MCKHAAMFRFCPSDCRDGIASIYHESGISGHCLTVQMYCTLLTGDGKDGRGAGEAARGVFCRKKAATVERAGGFVAKRLLERTI